MIGGLELEVETSIRLKAEWKRQARKLADLFASKLGFSREDYIATLPWSFPTQPEGSNTPLLVQPPTEKLDLVGILRLAGIYNSIPDLSKLQIWNSGSGNFSTPTKPYSVWVDDGSSRLNQSPDQVRQSLNVNQRCGSVIEGIALFIHKPEILLDHYIDMPGSKYQIDEGLFVPYLARKAGKVTLGYYWSNHSDPAFGTIVVARVKNPNLINKIEKRMAA